jgi:hypothetical protein
MSLRGKAGTPAPRPGSRARARQIDANDELRLSAEGRSVEYPEDCVVAGDVDQGRREVVLVRGDFTPVVVPFSWFGPTPSGLVPDFSDFEIVGTGATLRFGEYEVPVFAVLGQEDRRVLGGR